LQKVQWKGKEWQRHAPSWLHEEHHLKKKTQQYENLKKGAGREWQHLMRLRDGRDISVWGDMNSTPKPYCRRNGPGYQAPWPCVVASSVTPILQSEY